MKKIEKAPYEMQSDLFKALNHPVRLAILDVLREDEACVCHLEAALGQRQAYISQQLAVLRAAGIIRDRRDGWNVFYQVTDPAVFEIVDLARRLAAGEEARPAPFDLPDCPCPRCEAKKKAGSPSAPGSQRESIAKGENYAEN